MTSGRDVRPCREVSRPYDHSCQYPYPPLAPRALALVPDRRHEQHHTN